MFNNILRQPFLFYWMQLRIQIIAFALLSAMLFGQELDTLISSHGSHILGISPIVLLKESNLKRLTWNNESHTQIRYSKSYSQEKFTFDGIQIVEAVFNFPDKARLASMQISLHNRGDCGDWSKDKFNKTVNRIKNRITEITKNRNPDSSSRDLGGETTRQMLWRTSGYDMALRWSISDRGPEFITINLEPRGAIQKLSQDIKASVKANELVRNVRKESNGTRWIDVPMVNQGDKGYCMVAVMERLFKYYNSSMDQHIIAQLMEADANGTDLRKGMEALKSSAHKLQIRVREIYANPSFQTLNEFTKMLDRYNNTAKRAGKSVIDLREARRVDYKFDEVFSNVKKGTYVKMRQNERPGADRMFITVKDSIDRGIPLMWMVIIFPGDLRQQPKASFHARLINGYNSNTKEIIYTDTWGPGHEKKTMKLAEAWAISNMILNIRPQ